MTAELPDWATRENYETYCEFITDEGFLPSSFDWWVAFTQATDEVEWQNMIGL